MSANHIYLMLRSGADEMRIEGVPELIARFVKAAYPGGLEVVEQGEVEGGSQPVQVSTPVGNGGANDLVKQRAADFITFYRRVMPEGQGDQVLLITYFYQKHGGLETLTIDEYEQAYNLLRRIPVETPGDPRSSVQNVVKRTPYLRNAERGRYMLTLAGEEYVENLLAERGTSA